MTLSSGGEEWTALNNQSSRAGTVAAETECFTGNVREYFGRYCVCICRIQFEIPARGGLRKENSVKTKIIKLPRGCRETGSDGSAAQSLRLKEVIRGRKWQNKTHFSQFVPGSNGGFIPTPFIFTRKDWIELKIRQYTPSLWCGQAIGTHKRNSIHPAAPSVAGSEPKPEKVGGKEVVPLFHIDLRKRVFIGICILATDLMPLGSLFMSLLDGDAFSRDALLRVEQRG